MGDYLTNQVQVSHKTIQPGDHKKRLYTEMALNDGKDTETWAFLDKPDASGKNKELNVTSVEMDRTNSKPANVLFSLHFRPPTATVDSENGGNPGKFTYKNTGISIEASASGGIGDQEELAASKIAFQNRVDNSEPDFIEGSKNLSHDPGAFVSRVARYIAKLPQGVKLNPKQPPKTMLGMIKLPVDQAFNKLYKLTDNGINVSSQAVMGLLDVHRRFKLPVDINDDADHNKKPELLWSINHKRPTTLASTNNLFQKIANALMTKTNQWSLFSQGA